METIDKIISIADYIKKNPKVFILSGAGTSTNSGIPDFRSKDTGLWNTIDPMKYLSKDAFYDDPILFHNFLFKIIASMESVKPNVGHYALARMEQKGIDVTIATQNIDGLHQASGSTNVLELHGNIKTASCVECGFRSTMKSYRSAVARECEDHALCHCGNLLKPDMVLFGDNLPECFDRAMELAEKTPIVIAIGTSLTVYPVALIAGMGKRLVIFEARKTPIFRYGDIRVKNNYLFF